VTKEQELVLYDDILVVVELSGGKPATELALSIVKIVRRYVADGDRFTADIRKWLPDTGEEVERHCYVQAKKPTSEATKAADQIMNLLNIKGTIRSALQGAFVAGVKYEKRNAILDKEVEAELRKDKIIRDDPS